MSETELAERLKRLERDNRRLKWAGFAMLLGLVGIALLPIVLSAARPNATNGQQITVRDPASGNRAVLSGEGLILYDSKGRVRVELQAGAKKGPLEMAAFPGAWLKLYDSEGRPGVELTEQMAPPDFVQGFTKAGSTGDLVMLDYEGDSVSAANLGVGTDTGLWLTRTHLDQGSRWPHANDTDAALLIAGGSAGLQVRERENTRIGLFARQGKPALDLTDADGYATEIGASSFKYPSTGAVRVTSAASIIMLGNDEQHHVIWKAP